LLGFNKTKLLSINTSADIVKDLSGVRGSFSIGSVVGAKGTYLANKGLGYRVGGTTWGPVELFTAVAPEQATPDANLAKVSKIGIGVGHFQLTNKSFSYWSMGLGTISSYGAISPYVGLHFRKKF
jgi:hypothetical protein